MPVDHAKAWLYKHGQTCDKSNRKGAYTLCDLKPTQSRKPPTKKIQQTDYRASTGTTTEQVKQLTGTTSEPVKRVFRTFTGSITEHNVFIPLPVCNSIKSVAQVKG